MSAASEETPLVANNNNNNNSEHGSTGSSGADSQRQELWDELDQPWPSTFERAVGLLASPVQSRQEVQRYTHSPRPGSTPVALRRRSTLTRGYLRSPDTAAVLRQRQERMSHGDDEEDGDTGGGGRRRQHNRAGSERGHEKKGVVKTQSLDFGARVDVTNTRLQEKAQKAKEYRQQFLQKQSSDGDTKITDSERDGLLRSPGYAKEVQSTRYKKEQQQQQQDAHGGGAARGSATFLQSAFNLANILMGVGLLGLPFGFRVAGYYGGFVCVAVFGVVTWRTSVLIGRELNGDPRPSHAFTDNPFKSPHAPGTDRGRLLSPIAGFPDIARRSFGRTGCLILSLLLYFELFSCVCIFFVSIGDHLHSMFPGIPLETHTIVAACISLVPTILLHSPALLSYFSMVGTFATVAVVATVVGAAAASGSMVEELQARIEQQTGRVVTEPPYIRWGDTSGIVMCLGLVAYCFSGHAIVPSIYTSMKEPQRFEEMVTLTFVLVMLVCFAVACAGYYMFGSTVADQVTLSLEAAFHGGGFMDILIWLMILTAFSKTTLTIFPLALGMEEIFAPYFTSELGVELMSGVIKFVITISGLMVSLYVPSFSFLCALTGMICTMTVSVIFPAAAYWKIYYHHISTWEHIVSAIFVVLGIFMAVVGTIQTV